MKTLRRKATATATAGFPFLGQGDAEYFEWFEMWIWFAAPVPKALRSKLIAGAPPPCALDVEWPAPELMRPATGDQWIAQHLIDAYGPPAAKKRLAKAVTRREDDDAADVDALLAGPEQAKFNADIERWLLDVHAQCPIIRRGAEG